MPATTGDRLPGEHIWEIPDPPEGKYRRYEILDGRLYVSDFPLRVHQHVLGSLIFEVRRHVEAHALGEVILGPIGVMLAEYDAVVPDIAFVSNAREGILSERAVEGVPDLIIEITEPATYERDRGVKLQRYAATGVPHYWVVDALEKRIEEYVLGEDGYGPPSVYGVGDVFQPVLFPGLAIEISRLWP
jgi:Uma2 family endonuclease